MMVLILERVPASLRGELSRWLIEPKAGVFVGRLPAIVRDMLWEKACRSARGGAAMMLYSSQNEQGFSVRAYGDTSRSLVDMEGIVLVNIPQRKRDQKQEEEV
jgi:CRISPR-associated protein Cas2